MKFSPSIKLLIPLVFLLFTGGCASIDHVLKQTADAMSSPDPVTGKREVILQNESLEIAQAEKNKERFLAEARKRGIKLDEELPMWPQVQRVWEQIHQVLHRPYLPWEVHLVEMPESNAFALGGGKIFIYSGMWEGETAFKNDDELAAVLAHEAAHNTARHVSEGHAMRSLYTVTRSKDEVNHPLLASYNTVYEDEADRYAALSMALAGYDPHAGVAYWKRMHRAHGSNSLSLRHTHPLNDDRAKNMAAYAEKVMPYLRRSQVNAEWKAILRDNSLVSYKDLGEESGVSAFTSAIFGGLDQAIKARNELKNRERRRHQEMALAGRAMSFTNMKIGTASNGGKGLFGLCSNVSGQEVTAFHAELVYVHKQRIVLRRSFPADTCPMHPGSAQFGVVLDNILYDGVRVEPLHVTFKESSTQP
jgi:Zn-dependent protease with chaperone function